MLYNVVFVSAVQHGSAMICTDVYKDIYICPLPFEPRSYPTPIPPTIPRISVTTECSAELPRLYSSFPLASCFTHGSVYMSVLLSQFVPFSPSPSMSTSPFPTSVSIPALLIGLSVPFL